MDFLNSSETFLGVLLTLNVLCVYAERQSNFILRLLLEQREKFTNSLKSEQRKIRQRIQDFEKSDDYITIDKILSMKDGERKDPMVLSQAIQIMYNYTIELKSSQTDLSSCYSTMDSIESANEQYRAPLFTLLFGILIFSINEISQWLSFTTAHYILPGVWILTLLACIYWTAIWFGFGCRSINNSNDVIKVTIWKKIDKKLNPIYGGIIKIITCGACLSIILYYLNINSLDPTYRALIIVSGSLILITLIGIWRLYDCTTKGRYSIMHMIGHLSAFVVYATFIAIAYAVWGNHHCDNFFYNKTALCGTVVFFVLLNGLIFPFLLPYTKYKKPYTDAINSLSNQSNTIESAIKKFKDKYTELSRQQFAKSNR